jgi:hypothetical protein
MQSDGNFDMLNIWCRAFDGLGAASTTPLNFGMTKSKTMMDFTEVDDESEEEEDESLVRHLQLFMVKPDAAWRISWDLLGLIMVAADAILLPLQLLEPEDSVAFTVFFWMARLFWTLDIPISLFTGNIQADGNVEMDLRKVAWQYAKTWMAPDVAIQTLDWAEVLMDAIAGGGMNTGQVRIIRLLRIARVVRVSKLPQLMAFFDERLRSETLLLVMSIIKIGIFIVLFAHFVACIWFGIGNCQDAERCWVAHYELQELYVEEQYAISFHWSLTQYVGGMDAILPRGIWERVFAIIIVFITFIIAAALVSSLTSSLTRLHIIAGKKAGQFVVLRRYLCDRKVPAELMVRVQKNAQHALMEKQRNLPESEVELLKYISEPLLVEIHFEEHSPTLKTHPFFALYLEMNPAGMRKLCHTGVSINTLSRGDVIFSTGQTPDPAQMYHVLSGMLSYKQEGKGVSKVSIGTWIAEAVLWVSWRHQGVLRAKTEHCRMLALNAKAFQDIASQFHNLEFHPGLYAAQYVELLREATVTQDLSDLDDKEIAEEIVDSAYYQQSDEECQEREAPPGGRRRSSFFGKLGSSSPHRTGSMRSSDSRLSSRNSVSGAIMDRIPFHLGIMESENSNEGNRPGTGGSSTVGKVLRRMSSVVTGDIMRPRFHDND